jgi:hypothetical protein
VVEGHYWQARVLKFGFFVVGIHVGDVAIYNTS